MKTMTILGVALVLLSGCDLFGPSGSPTEAAEAYLRAGSAEDGDAIRAHLDPACADNEAMARVDAVRMMGAPITIEELTVNEVEATDAEATVSYSLAGPAHGSGGTQTILGVEVTTGQVDIGHAEQSGTLHVRVVDGEWRVACP